MVAKTALETINSLLDDLRPLLLLAGIPKEQIRVQVKKHRADSLARAFDWLHDLEMSSEYVQMAYVYKLLPKETWEHYKLFGLEGLREQILLGIASRDLLKRWRRKRPVMFNKRKENVFHKT